MTPRWWEIEDHGGFPPYGQWREPEDNAPWPSGWERRPHP